MCIQLSLLERCDNYDTGPYTVTFLAGTTRATFKINIIDDDIYEGPESFNIVIDPQLPDRVTLGLPSTATVTIVDDEKRK